MLMIPDVIDAASLPENISSLSISRRAWNGVSVDVSEWRGSGRVAHRFPNETKTRLVTLLEEVGSPCEPRLRETQPCPVGYTPQHLDFVPAGLEMWGFSSDVRLVKDVTLIFDSAVLVERIGIQLDGELMTTPRLRFADARIQPLMKLLADAVNDPDPAVQLYGDGLITAIAARLFTDAPEASQDAKGLTPRQFKLISEYLDEHLPKRIELAELAALVGLSQPHFSRAFKASTGMAPYRWQLDARVRRAQALLIGTNASLEQIAEDTGFADAVHFGRTFRNITGTTPAAWRRDRNS